jgi:hypothetical protein
MRAPLPFVYRGRTFETGAILEGDKRTVAARALQSSKLQGGSP